LSVRYQCGILSLNRSSLYYERIGLSEQDQRILDEMDKIYMDFPIYGSRRMSRELKRRGFKVGRQRARSLMRILGVEAIYPYLLRDVTIDKPDMAWAADITYIRLKHGFVYLVAVMDLYSRYIVSWRISNTLETEFCCEALKEALEKKIANPTLADAIMDRIVHNAYRLELKGESMRKRKSSLTHSGHLEV